MCTDRNDLMFSSARSAPSCLADGDHSASVQRESPTEGGHPSAQAAKPDTSQERLDTIFRQTSFGSREQLEQLRDFRNDVAVEAWKQGKYGTWLPSRIAANLFGNVVDAGGFPGLIAGSVRIRGSGAARREAMRLEGIPVSRQPRSQWSPRGPGNTPAGRELVYETPGGAKHVQHQLADRNHDPHWEAGLPKGKTQIDPAGRQRLRSDKSKVDEFGPDPASRPAGKTD
jgi:hypothetical protein